MSGKPWFIAADIPWFFVDSKMTSLNCRTTSAVRSVDPSSTTMISLRCHVWAIADSSVWAIVFSALYAVIRIETSGFISQRSEIRGQRSEVRGQRSEVRGQRSEIRDQRSEIRGQKSEIRNQRSEIREQKMGIHSRG